MEKLKSNKKAEEFKSISCSSFKWGTGILVGGILGSSLAYLVHYYSFGEKLDTSPMLGVTIAIGGILHLVSLIYFILAFIKKKKS